MLVDDTDIRQIHPDDLRGAIGSVLAALISGFLGLSLWQMPLAVLGILLVISGPSMLMAYMKLRRRNLAPLLDANGWAVNTEARINVSFGGTLTQTAELPQGAERTSHDPYAEKEIPWGLYLALIIAFMIAISLWRHGVFGN